MPANMNFKVSILPDEDNSYSLGSTTKRWKLNGVDIFDAIYPIGSVYISVTSTSPATLFGGTWEQITGKFLLACDTTYTAGSTGGSTTMAHTHIMTHTHQQVATTSGGPSNNTSGANNDATAGPSNNTSGSTAITQAQMAAHTHNRGTMNITGTFKVDPHYGYNRISETSGAFYSDTAGARSSGGSMESDKVNVRAVFDASRSWSGATSSVGSGSGHTHTLSSHTHTMSSHTHTLSSHTHSTSATTTGEASSSTTSAASNIDNMPPYLAVYVWKRTA